MGILSPLQKVQMFGESWSAPWEEAGGRDARKIRIVRQHYIGVISRLTCSAAHSGLFVNTSSAFTTPTLGTKKDNPKARYTLLVHAVETFDSESRYE